MISDVFHLIFYLNRNFVIIIIAVMEFKNFVIKGVFFAFLFEINAVSAQKMAEEELKVNVRSITNSLNVVQQLDPKTYSFDTSKKLPAGKQYGFLVEDFARQYPELMKEKNYSVPAGKNAFRTISVEEIDIQRLIPVLVGAIKEQQLEIEKLRQELNAIKR